MTTEDVTKIDFERLRSLSRRVQLRDVALVAASFQCLQHSNNFPRDVQKSFLFRLAEAQWEWSADTGMASVILVFNINARVAEEKKGQLTETEVFQQQCVWNALYSIRVDDDFEIDDDVMADFCFANGQLNVYPYVRQFVQDLTGRAGWPALVMPVLTVPSTRPVGVVHRAEDNERKEVLFKAAH